MNAEDGAYVLDLMSRASIGSEKAYSLLKKLDFKREDIEKFHICLELVNNPSVVLDLLSDISAATLGDGSIDTFTDALDELQKLADTTNYRASTPITATLAKDETDMAVQMIAVVMQMKHVSYYHAHKAIRAITNVTNIKNVPPAPIAKFANLIGPLKNKTPIEVV
eukprot:30667-Pelagococcus_subviridis.AAC.7